MNSAGRCQCWQDRSWWLLKAGSVMTTTASTTTRVTFIECLLCIRNCKGNVVELFYLIWCQLRKDDGVAFYFDFPVGKERNSWSINLPLFWNWMERAGKENGATGTHLEDWHRERFWNNDDWFVCNSETQQRECHYVC